MSTQTPQAKKQIENGIIFALLFSTFVLKYALFGFIDDNNFGTTLFLFAVTLVIDQFALYTWRALGIDKVATWRIYGFALLNASILCTIHKLIIESQLTHSVASHIIGYIIMLLYQICPVVISIQLFLLLIIIAMFAM